MRISDWSSDVCSSDLHHRSLLQSQAREVIQGKRDSSLVWFASHFQQQLLDYCLFPLRDAPEDLFPAAVATQSDRNKVARLEQRMRSRAPAQKPSRKLQDDSSGSSSTEQLLPVVSTTFPHLDDFFLRFITSSES